MTTTCQHCGRGLLSRDVACYEALDSRRLCEDDRAVCQRCYAAEGYAYVVSEGGYVRGAFWTRGDYAVARSYYY